jgi:hypothetical protein
MNANNSSKRGGSMNPCNEAWIAEKFKGYEYLSDEAQLRRLIKLAYQEGLAEAESRVKARSMAIFNWLQDHGDGWTNTEFQEAWLQGRE